MSRYGRGWGEPKPRADRWFGPWVIFQPSPESRGQDTSTEGSSWRDKPTYTPDPVGPVDLAYGYRLASQDERTQGENIPPGQQTAPGAPQDAQDAASDALSAVDTVSMSAVPGLERVCPVCKALNTQGL